MSSPGTASRSAARTSGCSTGQGEFTAEVPTSATGQFRFFAAPGAWTLRTLAPGAEPVDNTVTAATGMIAELEISVG